MLGLITMVVMVVLAGWVLYSVNKLTLEQDMIIARLEALEAARATVGSMQEPLAEPRTEPR